MRLFRILRFLDGPLFLGLVSAKPLIPAPPPGDGRADGIFHKVVVSDTASVRYRNAGALCETTPGVSSLAGFVDLDATNDSHVASKAHTFYWFTEARHNADTAPLTIWLNGGPGSDSLLGFFGEIGPCSVTPDLNTTINPYAWSELSNLLVLSQPLGVGFSYESSNVKDVNKTTTNGTRLVSWIDNTEKSAVMAWNVLQAFMQALPQMDPHVKTRTIHLWTESYGGHYGPAFFRHFHEMNERVKNGSAPGIALELGTLGVGNGHILLISQFPEYAVNNTYNFKLVPEEVSRYMTFACHMPNGCVDQAQQCLDEYYYDSESTYTIARCTEATYMCRDNVEAPYYFYSGRNIYDIRRSDNDSIIPQDFMQFLNLPSTREALGISSIPELAAATYAWQSDEVYQTFARSGDYAYPVFLSDIEYLLDHGIRVILMYGDADYIANWFGGEAVSLALNHSQSSFFHAAPYVPLVFGSPLHGDNSSDSSNSTKTYGKVREQGNLSFAVIYDAGHFVPFYKPELALEIYRRAILGLDLPTGRRTVNSTAVPLVPDSPLPLTKTEPATTATAPSLSTLPATAA